MIGFGFWKWRMRWGGVCVCASSDHYQVTFQNGISIHKKECEMTLSKQEIMQTVKFQKKWPHNMSHIQGTHTNCVERFPG